MIDVDVLRQTTLAFVASCRLLDAGIGAYRYSLNVEKPTLYASTYAVTIRALYRDLDSLSESQKLEWADYFNAHQDDDGLFRDPVIYDQGWYKDDPLWCGRPHLTCHVLIALACLGANAKKSVRWLDDYKDPDRLSQWLEHRDWADGVDTSGNEIMNVGTILQYARDFHNDKQAGASVEFMLEWLSKNHLNPATGLWGSVDIEEPIWLSHAVQAAYHWWPIYFYDRRPIPFMKRAIDTVLATRNPKGGFGWGVHNTDVPFNSSACEDIDSIDPLCRMMQLTDYRRDEIRSALAGAADWVLQNRMSDGGFVFMLDKSFEYGHPQLRGECNQGAMFPTWFRTLSLAMIGKAIPEHPLGYYSWQFSTCPGTQFWR